MRAYDEGISTRQERLCRARGEDEPGRARRVVERSPSAARGRPLSLSAWSDPNPSPPLPLNRPAPSPSLGITDAESYQARHRPAGPVIASSRTMFAPRTGSRLVAQVARLDLAAFPSRPTPSSSALLAQARCLATLSPSCNRSSPTPSLSSSLLRSSILARSRPDTWTIASAAPRRSFHSSRPAAVIRDSYFQDDRRRSNARDGGRGPTPKGGWERLKRAFWDAVLRFERLPANVVVRAPSPRSLAQSRVAPSLPDTDSLSGSWPNDSHAARTRRRAQRPRLSCLARGRLLQVKPPPALPHGQLSAL
jgi:hypothetical protein